jgi:hypothetical protein
MLTVRVVDAADFPAVDELRISSYRRATWFTLRDAERIRCARDFPCSRVTAVYDGATPVATICQTLALDRPEAEQLLELDAPLGENDFPALVISRAATAEGYAGLRLNHVLRWFTLQAVQADSIRAIVAGHARGTPNLRVMADLGYRFIEVARSYMSQVDVNTEHVLSYLPADMFAAAQARLEPLLASVLPQVRWEGLALTFEPWLTQAAAEQH